MLAGPWCGQILADRKSLKLNVLESVMTPACGMDARSRWKHDPWIWLFSVRNKYSVAVDITTPEGQALKLPRLPMWSLKIIRQGLIWFGLCFLKWAEPEHCVFTGFGQDGPRAEEPGYDFRVCLVWWALQASLMMWQATKSWRGCCRYSNWFIFNHQAALIARSHTGRGQYIDTSMYRSRHWQIREWTI